MARQLGENLKNHYTDILDNIDHIDHLLSIMESKFVISKIEKRFCTDVFGEDIKRSRFLDILRDKDETSLGIFVKALYSNGQDHLAEVMQGDGTHHLMKTEHKEVLKKNTHFICENMDCDIMLDILISHSCIIMADAELIRRCATNFARNSLLLQIISRKADRVYFQLIQVLRETSQAHVAEKFPPENRPSQSLCIDNPKKVVRVLTQSLDDDGDGKVWANLERMNALHYWIQNNVDDQGNREVIRNDILPCVIKMLENEKYQQKAAGLAFTLSFIEDIQLSECKQALEKLLKNRHDKNSEASCKTAKRALFQIKQNSESSKELKTTSKTDVQQKKTKEDRRGKHIFISYSRHTNAKTVHDIADALERDGYKVWIDRDKMRGQIEDMAKAIEDAWVSLLCYSEAYKQSDNCHLEASYCRRMQVTYIPLLMEKDYDPDGWLGFLIGSMLYYTFHDESNFEESYKVLCKRLDRVVDAADSSGVKKK